jgi:hypothetical protein
VYSYYVPDALVQTHTMHPYSVLHILICSYTAHCTYAAHTLHIRCTYAAHKLYAHREIIKQHHERAVRNRKEDAAAAEIEYNTAKDEQVQCRSYVYSRCSADHMCTAGAVQIIRVQQVQCRSYMYRFCVISCTLVRTRSRTCSRTRSHTRSSLHRYRRQTFCARRCARRNRLIGSSCRYCTHHTPYTIHHTHTPYTLYS